jgi:hypothetical protein
MFRRTDVMWVLAASTIWLSACSRTPAPEQGIPTEPLPVGMKQITIHVPAMIDRQGIT